MMGAIEEKFHVGRNLTFVFIDSWAKHPMNLEDSLQQDAFKRETDILWNFAISSKEFVFKSIQDVLEENEKLRAEVEYLNENIDNILEQLISINSDIGNLTEKQEVMSDTLTGLSNEQQKLSEIQAKQEIGLMEAGKDIVNLSIVTSKHGDNILDIEETLSNYKSQFDAIEARISSNENKLSAHDYTLDSLIENVNDHQLKIDMLLQTSASHQTSIDDIGNTIQNLDLLPLGRIMSYHPKNGETFPAGWLPCDGGEIQKGPLKGKQTPGNQTFIDTSIENV